MIEKPLMILLFMYSVNFSLLAGQYVVGDVYDVTLRSTDGTEIRSSILEYLNTGTLNTVTGEIAQVNNTRNSTLDAVTDSFEIGITIAFEILTLLTGTYIFNLLYLLGVPPIFLAGLIAMYAIMLGRAIIAYVRGV